MKSVSVQYQPSPPVSSLVEIFSIQIKLKYFHKNQVEIFSSSQVILAIASAYAQAQVLLNGAVPYPYAAHGLAPVAPYAAAPVAAPLPADYAVSVGAPVAPAVAPPQVDTDIHLSQ